MNAREDYIRGSLALHLTDLWPPILRQSLIADEALSATFGLATDGIIKFSPGSDFQRSVLLAAVRTASKAEHPITVKDEMGDVWRIRFDRSENLPEVVIESGGRNIRVRHLGLLSERQEDRNGMLEAEAARVNLPREALRRWSALIAVRSLTDAEVTEFTEDINATPLGTSAAIVAALQQKNVDFDALVPRSAGYYERLIGRWDGQVDIAAYADTALPEIVDGLLAFDAESGFRLSLLLCSHPFALERLAGRTLTPSAFDTAARWARDGGDAMTRCALLELALLRDDVMEETKPILAEIAAALCKPTDGVDADFELLSALFVFVYGQLSYIKILANKPTFWRRMAALAQAGLIVRCLGGRRGASLAFARELRAARTRPFALQVCADMRLGPMWQSDFGYPAQLRNEFVGRVISRAAVREKAAQRLLLHERILGETESLKSSVNLFLITRAGPLEDNVPLVRELAGENLGLVEAGLMEAKPTARSFAPLVNSVFLFRQSTELANNAAAALQRAQYRLESASGIEFLTALWGLATCAAVTRSHALADAVFTVIRYYRRFSPASLDLDDAARIGLIACASRDSLSEWSSAVGGLMADFAFQSLTPDEAGALEAYIRDFCDLTPELWATCGPALSAAEAVAA